jgi:hypothetical protein
VAEPLIMDDDDDDDDEDDDDVEMVEKALAMMGRMKQKTLNISVMVHQHLRDTLSTSLCRQLIVVGIHPSNR